MVAVKVGEGGPWVAVGPMVALLESVSARRDRGRLMVVVWMEGGQTRMAANTTELSRRFESRRRTLPKDSLRRFRPAVDSVIHSFKAMLGCAGCWIYYIIYSTIICYTRWHRPRATVCRSALTRRHSLALNSSVAGRLMTWQVAGAETQGHFTIINTLL